MLSIKKINVNGKRSISLVNAKNWVKDNFPKKIKHYYYYFIVLSYLSQFTYLRVHEHGRTVRLRLFNHNVDNATSNREWKCHIDGTGILVKQLASRFHQAVQIQLGKDNLQTAFQIAHTILLISVMLDHVFNRLIRNNNLVRLECNLRSNFRNQILLRNVRLVLLGISVGVNAVHSVKKNGVHF